jgi:tetratricopeptide (TPR) repeat protein
MLHFLALAKRLVGRTSQRSKAAPRHDEGALLEFQSEGSTSETPVRKPRSSSKRRGVVVACAATLLALASAAVVYVASTRLQAERSVAPADPALGTAVVDSNPPGLVTIEGVVRGQTPLSLRLPAGTHAITITAGQATRSVSLEIEAGATVKQYVEFAPTATAVVTTGRLDVTSQPPGASVTVDGNRRGITPISIDQIAVGPHQVAISSGDSTIRRAVTIRPGATSSVDASLASPDSAAGWLALSSPVELTLSEDDQIIGTTRAARVMLPSGSHNIVLTNTSLEFQTAMPVRIEGGKTLKRAVALPAGSLSINASCERGAADRRPRSRVAASAAGRAPPHDRDHHQDADASRHGLQAMTIRMSDSAVRCAAALVFAVAAASTVRADSLELGNAKSLYAQASYEDALVQLNGITDADVANQVDQYRALCLLALGREREAQASLERIVVRAPLYVVKVDDASPKLVTLFQQVRQRALPAAAKDLYAKARANFDGSHFAQAQAQFEEMLVVLKEAGVGDSGSPIADLKQLGEGFLKLARTALTPAEPAPPPPAVRAAPAKPAIYTPGDADVVPPAEIVRELPPWNPPASLPNGTYSGKIQIDIDEQGLVERSVLVEAIAPPYDQRLLAASKTWRFQPATKDGVAVKYRKIIAVVLQPVSRP